MNMYVILHSPDFFFLFSSSSYKRTMIIVIVIIITLITNRGTVRNPYWNSGLLQLRRPTSRLVTWSRICLLFVFFCCLCLALFTLTRIFFYFFQWFSDGKYFYFVQFAEFSPIQLIARKDFSC